MEKKRSINASAQYRRTKVDWFGIIMMFVLLVCSLAIFARLMGTQMLTTTNLVLVMVALLVINGLHTSVLGWIPYAVSAVSLLLTVLINWNTAKNAYVLFKASE